MTTRNQLRKAALALPETEERTRTAVFSVHGKEFASLSEDGWVQLHLPPDRVQAALSGLPSGRPNPLGLRVPLTDIDGMALNALVRAAWRHRAPKRLLAAVDHAEAAEPGQGDLPAEIGRPATRALHGAGLTTLDRIAARSESELLRLHGVGPKAVRILKQALAEQGRALQP